MKYMKYYNVKIDYSIDNKVDAFIKSELLLMNFHVYLYLLIIIYYYLKATIYVRV